MSSPVDTPGQVKASTVHAYARHLLQQALHRLDYLFLAAGKQEIHLVLADDLTDRGLLGETLVGWTGEFGRTPKINGTAGRDHWPKVFSVVLAGGGIKKGSIYGKSDATASEPEEDGLTVEDLAHTVYHCLGIDADKKLMSPGDRPIDIVREGHTRKELLA